MSTLSTDAKRKYARLLGKIGGYKLKAERGLDYYKWIGARALEVCGRDHYVKMAKKRWALYYEAKKRAVDNSTENVSTEVKS